MEVILNKSIHNLGKKNEIVKVSAGHARNYLIPNGIASEATRGMYKAVVELKKQSAHKEEVLKKEAQELALRMANINLEIRTKAGTKGKVFGAINSAKISDSLKEQGVFVDKHNIIIPSNIKDLGNYKAIIKLHEGVECELAFSVIIS